MPLSLATVVAAAITNTVAGAVGRTDACVSIEMAHSVQQQNIARFEEHKRRTEANIKDLENIVDSVEKLIKDDLSYILDKLQNQPIFNDIKKSGIRIPEYYRVSNMYNDKTLNMLLKLVVMNFVFSFMLFDFLGTSWKRKKEEAWEEVFRTEEEVNKICSKMDKIDDAVKEYYLSIKKVKDKFLPRVNMLGKIVFAENRVDFNDFNQQEKLMCENTFALALILNKMIRVQLTKDDEINYEAIDESIANANEFLQKNDLETDLQ